MPPQSETTKPWNPRSGVPLLSVPVPFSLVVIRYWLAWSFSPFQLLYEIMTEPTLFETADRYGGMAIFSHPCSDSCAAPPLRLGDPAPPAVCPSPIKHFSAHRVPASPTLPCGPP